MSINAWLIPIELTRPPLTANQRLHWRKKAAITADFRRDIAARVAHIPAVTKCRTQMVWFVTDKRRRDVDNLVPTFKVMCDALVDAGIVPDDTPEFMEKVMPVIHLVDKELGPAMLQLIIEEI
jgi:crossover junction endodeoxyribonuclease RusA